MGLSSSQRREDGGAVASESPFSTDFLSMLHFDHIHDESVIFYRIGNPINALTNTRAILIAGELFTAGRTGRFSQNLDVANNPLTVLFILDGCYLFSRRRLDEDFIFGHGVSTFSRIDQSPSSAHSFLKCPLSDDNVLLILHIKRLSEIDPICLPYFTNHRIP